MPKFSIVIVTYNSEQHIGNCLTSMQANSEDAEVVVVDNSGKSYGMDGVIVNQMGSYPSGLNQGIEVSNGEYIVCCNPDIVVTPRWLDKMKWAIDQGYGMVGPMSKFVSGVQNQMMYKVMPSQINLLDVSFIIGFCFMIPRDVFEKVGKFDEQFSFENDDIDYSLRVRQAGLPIAVMPHCYIEHVGHQSAMTNPDSHNMRIECIYKILKKYPDTNFAAYMGSGWPLEWLKELSQRFPDIQNVRSYQISLQAEQK